MAVTISSRSVVFTAVSDEDTRVLYLDSLALVGVGMTAGQRLTITDSNGSVVADHYVENANENKEFLTHCKAVRGLKLTAVPAGGTWTVVAGLR